MTPLRDDILKELHNGPMSARQASVAVGTSYQCALTVLSRLCELGKARRNGSEPSASRGKRSFLFELIQPQKGESQC